jgi:hypothetical protein
MDDGRWMMDDGGNNNEEGGGELWLSSSATDLALANVVAIVSISS